MIGYVSIALIGFIVGGIVGHYLGWRDGVRDTERRWSDAVGRGR